MFVDLYNCMQFVFVYCDLLCVNIIMYKDDDNVVNGQLQSNGFLILNGNFVMKLVSFIDYEYVIFLLVVFDIVNYFVEWVGYDCDYNMVLMKFYCYVFISEYVRIYIELIGEFFDYVEEM